MSTLAEVIFGLDYREASYLLSSMNIMLKTCDNLVNLQGVQHGNHQRETASGTWFSENSSWPDVFNVPLGIQHFCSVLLCSLWLEFAKHNVGRCGFSEPVNVVHSAGQ